MVENGHGRVLGMGVRFRDITILHCEQRWFSSRQHFSTGLLEATNDAMLVVAEKGQIYDRNSGMNDLWPFDESLLM